MPFRILARHLAFEKAGYREMKAIFLLLAVTSNLVALDLSTLDGKTYSDCRVSKVFPDSICVLYAGGGARVKFTNLPEPIRFQFGYQPEQAAAFERAEAEREARERALVAAQRQGAAQRQAAASGPNQPPGSRNGSNNNGSKYVGVSLAPPAAAANNPSGNQYGNRNANQSGNGYSIGGAQYVGVRLAGPGGGIRGVTIPSLTPPRPYGF